MKSSFNCIGILKMNVLQFNNIVSAIPDNSTAIYSLFVIYILASNKLITKVFPILNKCRKPKPHPAGKNNFPSSLFTLCKILL